MRMEAKRMKKTYLKPDAEYVNLTPEEILTGPLDGEIGTSDLPEGWE